MSKMPDRIWAWFENPETDLTGNMQQEVPKRGLFSKAGLDNRTEYVRADTVGLKCFYEEEDLPAKFIAIYSDNSGCNIFYEDGEGSGLYAGCEGGINGVEKGWFVDAGYLWFVPLPDYFDVLRDQ